MSEAALKPEQIQNLMARIKSEQQLAQQARDTAAAHERAAAELIDEAFRAAFAQWTR